ncbi:hypothetical protein G6011_06929 [Alternaria panax]|uniref:Uncharacterized protein n=1 Tax=Alternaria panax TaxID=48097 RepID=A0AAD4FB94_9PLEO|nr:hypothetical protein G6011_06929 [Alternaria panax]
MSSPSLFLPRGDVSYAKVANDTQHSNISLSHGISGPHRNFWTVSPPLPDGESHDTTVSQTPANGRMWTPLVHISGGSKQPHQRTGSKSSTTQHTAIMFQTGPDASGGLRDGVTDSANPFYGALQSTTDRPPFYATRNHIANDGKTAECNRTLTFDTFVDDAQLDDINPLRSKQHLFSSRSQDGTLTRRSIAPTYELISEGTIEIPSSCNTTSSGSLKLSSSTQNAAIWGTASTGTCSVVFGLTPDGYDSLRSREIAGDVHSIAWSPSGRNLHVLDSHASEQLSKFVFNFRISEDPTLQDVVGVDVLNNVTNALQIVAHPTETLMYIVTKDTNELVVLSLAGDTLVNNSTVVLRYRLLLSSLDLTEFRTTSLTISASRRSLWTLSQSYHQAFTTSFILNITTGEVVNVAARASWQGAGEGQLTAASFIGGDMVAIANSPTGYVTILGLGQFMMDTAYVSQDRAVHDYLRPMVVEKSGRKGLHIAASKVKSYGRALVDDYVNLGESIWID